jgi:IS5 family transposase
MAKIRPATWQAIHQILIQDALARQADTADRVRIDTTPVPTKIHAPSDSTLLYDGVRVLTRLCKQARTHTGFRDFHVHTRVAKRRMIAIQYTKPREKAQRTALYQDLLAATQQTLGESEAALLHCLSIQADHTSSRLDSLVRALTTMTALVLKVIDQTERRVLRHESVPATEKVVSLFEPHTDILVKDHRDTIYGHKICLTEGPSRHILDCNILHGNPPDSTLAIAPLRRLMEQYNVLPTQVAYDGGFASADNLHDIRGLGIPDVCFTKSRGLPQDAMVEDPHVYRALRRFRAGIESAISRLKRAFGLARCGWKGEAGFQRYVYARVVTANLMILAQQLC